MAKVEATVEELVCMIERGELRLPEMQRRYVWRSTRVRDLLDSLYRGYPSGAILLWETDEKEVPLQDMAVRQDDNPYASTRLLLDGQQRLTALNIGLRGKMALKLPRLWWNNLDAFPFRQLYLDLLWQPDEDDEEGLKYRFDFLTDNESSATSDEKCWFPVSQVLSMSEPHQITEWLIRLQLPKEQMIQASRVLHKLYEVIYNKPLVASYTEKDQELEKVLQIIYSHE